MKSSEQLDQLFTALAKAQASMSMASKSSVNPFFKSNYADLSEVVSSSRNALTLNGLCVAQPIIHEDGNDILCSILGHSSGQWISSAVILKPQKQDPQSLGSYITYMRRYAYASLVGIITADDDGESAMHRSPDSKIDTLTQDQSDRIKAEIKAHPTPKTALDSILGFNKIEKIEDLPQSKFESVMKWIKNPPKKGN